MHCNEENLKETQLKVQEMAGGTSKLIGDSLYRNKIVTELVYDSVTIPVTRINGEPAEISENLDFHYEVTYQREFVTTFHKNKHFCKWCMKEIEALDILFCSIKCKKLFARDKRDTCLLNGTKYKQYRDDIYEDIMEEETLEGREAKENRNGN